MTAVGSPPIVVTGPPRTRPRPSLGLALAGELQHGELVTWQGVNHVAYYYSPCIRAIDQSYFVAALCRPGTVCTD